MTDNGTRAALSTDPGEAPDGVWLFGSLVGLRDGKPYNKVTPCEVGLNIGGAIVAVQYRDRVEAGNALGASVAGDRIGLRVTNRNGANERGAWQFYTGPYDGAGDRGGWS